MTSKTVDYVIAFMWRLEEHIEARMGSESKMLVLECLC